MFIYSLIYIIFNAGEDGHITAMIFAISEIIQWYSLDCDIKLNKMAENKVSEIEILTVVNVFSLQSSIIVVYGWDIGHKAP